VTDDRFLIDLPMDGFPSDGVYDNDHLGTFDAARGAVHPITVILPNPLADADFLHNTKPSGEFRVKVAGRG
jgi:hypothetical protein